MVLQFYFQTFDYETLIFYQESFVDFLCEDNFLLITYNQSIKNVYETISS